MNGDVPAGPAIAYQDNLAAVTVRDLEGFFEGWADPRTPQEHLRILAGSTFVWVARDGRRVVGFINALSDGIQAGFISMLEVLPEYRGHGIGTELTRRMLGTMSHLAAIDLVCDEDLVPFYERLGLFRATAMAGRAHLRNGE